MMPLQLICLVLALLGTEIRGMYETVLTSSQGAALDQCMREVGFTSCYDMMMRVDAVRAVGCDGAGAFCSAEFPPAITIYGRGFGSTGHTVYVGGSRCSSVAYSAVTLSGDVGYGRLVCTGYSVGRDFAPPITVVNSVGENATGPAALHFGPPEVDRVSFNSSCVHDPPPANNSVTCYGDVTLTFSGARFPSSGRDLVHSSIGGVEVELPDGPPCTNTRTYEGDDGSVYVMCDLSEVSRAVPAKYDIRIRWGSLVASSNITLRIPDLGVLSSIQCENKDGSVSSWPAVPGGGTAYRPGVHALTLAADQLHTTVHPLRCVLQEEAWHVACCSSLGVGAPYTSYTTSCWDTFTYTAAVAKCLASGMRLCTQPELEAGQGSQNVTGCSDLSGRRVWVGESAGRCTSTWRCFFAHQLFFRGSWAYRCGERFAVELQAVPGMGGEGNFSCPTTATEDHGGVATVRCTPPQLQSGGYAIALSVDGVPVPTGTTVEWYTPPFVEAVKGCYDIGSSTMMCSPSTALLTIVGRNLHPVQRVGFGGAYCDFNTTAFGNQTLVAYHRILCHLQTMKGLVAARAELHIGKYVFYSDAPRLSVTHIPEVHSAFCGLPEGHCPASTGPITVVGSHFTAVAWNAPGDTASIDAMTDATVEMSIGGAPCDDLQVVNSTLLYCLAYNLTSLPALRTGYRARLTVEVYIGTQRAGLLATQLFRAVPYITHITGCPHGGCPGHTATPLTIIGGNFSIGGAAATPNIYLEDSPCGRVEVVSETELVCHTYPRQGARTSVVRVEMDGEWSIVPHYAVFALSCPEVDGVQCNGHGVCAESGQCICQLSAVAGFWEGAACQDCVPRNYGPQCLLECRCLKTGGVCDSGVNGTGLCQTCYTNHSGSLCTPCPGYPERVCGGHGVCNDTVEGDGSCRCEHDGWDPLKMCLQCGAGMWGPDCTQRCPGGLVCSGHGVCSEGTGGDGTCKCDTGWGEADCSRQCPGKVSPTVFCSGHGTCQASGLCLCYSDADKGYWNGKDDCSLCGLGWSGPQCKELCAVVNGEECYGHGTCVSRGCICTPGYCGIDCSRTIAECALAACPQATQWGDINTCSKGKCACFCPVAHGAVCSGRGTCDSGQYGSGLCRCERTRAGPACEHDCTECVNGGSTCDDTGRCICRRGYAGTHCTIACPGAEVGRPCGGVDRGVCDDGNDGTGTCTCNPGYAGLGCSSECKGGAANPCSGHGSCMVHDGSCDCVTTAIDGYWGGVACEKCAEPYAPPLCNTTCPGLIESLRVTCTGNGICNKATLQCVCYNSPSTGFWQGAECAKCASGFFGPGCQQECPGGACSPCSGHGVCNDGVLGDGKCTCHRGPTLGYWIGAHCGECERHYWGLQCNKACPALTKDGTVCRGRGTCREGRLGNGECICSTPGEYWGGKDCGVCQANFFGARCSLECPVHNDLHCNGHGACDDGLKGSGNCTCEYGWVGVACEQRCTGEGTEHGVCYGHGICTWDGGVATPPQCECFADTRRGFWDPSSSCAQCAFGYYDATTGCVKSCPGGPASPCSGKGVTASCNIDDGSCTCSSGWAGAACDVECSGGEKTPCSGHGECSPVNGACNCFASDSTGYWWGSQCDLCHPHYTSPEMGCRFRCPMASPCPGCAEEPCAGYGNCIAPVEGSSEARCIQCSTFTTVRCGSACERQGEEECAFFMCSPARYGPECQFWCPGSSPKAPFPCSGHGLCDTGKQGSGMCLCETMYKGEACDIECPKCVSGQGICDPTGVCQCFSGFAGELCQIECPGGFRSPCGKFDAVKKEYVYHGTCDMGRTGTGKCTCDEGWRGEGCVSRCSGVTPAGEVCSAHGKCLQLQEACVCDSNPVAGYWAPPDCARCQAGWVGENCTLQCVNGAGPSCKCNPGYYGAGCAAACPGRRVEVGRVVFCSGHGQCDDGSSGTGTCSCEADYYGKGCETRCTIAEHCSEYRREAVVCGPDLCMCISNHTHGYWGGDTCEKCSRDYWGARCLSSCNCNGNQYSCEQSTGTCNCYADPVNGFFDGPTCATCKAGYIGVRCQKRDVKITRVGSAGAPMSMNFTNMARAFLLTDEVYLRIIVGSSPPAVFSVATGTPEYDLTAMAALGVWNGTALGGQIRETTITILNQGASGVELVVLHRANLTRRSVVTVVSQTHHLHPLTTPVLEMSAPLAGFWVMVFDVGSGLEVHVVEEESGKVVHTQLLAGFDTYHHAVAEGLLLAVTGTLNGAPEVVVLTIATPQGNFASATFLSKSPMVADIFATPFAAHRLLLEREMLYLAFRRGDSLLLALVNTTRLDDPNAPALQCGTGYLCEAVMMNNAAWRVTRMAMDPSTGEGYLSVVSTDPATGAPLPSIMYRFDSSTGNVTGSTTLAYFAGEAESAVDIAAFDTHRMVFVLPNLTYLRLIALNAYFVSSVTPTVVDAVGGTPLTLAGKGFPVHSTPLCRFNGDLLPVLSHNSTAVVCETISQGSATVGCQGSQVDISFDGPTRFTNNDNVKVRMAFGATPLSAMPAKGATAGGMPVTVTGYGFDSGGFTTCKFEDDEHSVAVTATYHNTTTLTCSLPPWPRPTHHGRGVLRVSQDGTQYSKMGVPFSVVGEMTSFSASFGEGETFTVMSNDVVRLPTATAVALDLEGQEIPPFDTPPYDLTVHHTAQCEYTVRGSNATAVVALPLRSSSKWKATDLHVVTGMPKSQLSKGAAVLGGIEIVRPRQAVCNLTLEVYSSAIGVALAEGALFTRTVTFRVLPGAYARLRVVHTHEGDVNPLQPLEPIRLELVDGAGNLARITPRTVVHGILSATPSHPSLEQHVRLLFIPNDKTQLLECACERIMLPNLVFGAEYFITFRLLGNTTQGNQTAMYDDSVVPAVTPYLHRMRCAGSPNGEAQFAVIYTTECRTCPRGGRCDGGLGVNLTSGYWRWGGVNESALRKAFDPAHREQLLTTYTRLYPCTPSVVCENAVAVDNGTYKVLLPHSVDPVCREGHANTSILCSSCEEGYGMSGDVCSKCPARVVVVLQVVLLVVAMALVAGIIIYSTYKDSVKGARSMGFMQMKQVLTWIQSSAASSWGAKVMWPAAMELLYSIQDKFLTFHVGLHPFNCVASLNYYEKYAIIMTTPVMVAVVFGVVGMLIQLATMLRPNVDKRSSTMLSMSTSVTLEFSSTSEGDKVETAVEKLQGMVGMLGFMVPKVDQGGSPTHCQQPKNAGEEKSATYRFVVPPMPDLFCQSQSQQLVMGVTKPPPNDVTLTPSGHGITFVPPVFIFTHKVTQVEFTIVGAVVGTHEVTFSVSGTDKKLFQRPSPLRIVIFDEWRTGVLDKIVCALVVFFFLTYPMLIITMAGLLICDQIGPDGKAFLFMDRSIQCYTTQWWWTVAGNIIAFCVYGVGLPAGCFYYMLKKRKNLEDVLVRVKVGLLSRGYRPSFWYWEFVTMSRKIAVALTSLYIPSLWHRTYLLQWVFGFYLLLNLYLHPLSAQINHHTENVILLSQAFTMNMALMYFTEDLSGVLYRLSSILMVVINIAVFLGILGCYLWIWKAIFAQEQRHAKIQAAMMGELEEADTREITWRDLWWRLMYAVRATLIRKGLLYGSLQERGWLPDEPRVGCAALSCAAVPLPFREKDVLQSIMTNDVAFAQGEVTVSASEWSNMRRVLNAARFSMHLRSFSEVEGDVASEHSEDEDVAEAAEVARNYARLLHGTGEGDEHTVRRRSTRKPSTARPCASFFGLKANPRQQRHSVVEKADPAPSTAPDGGS